MLANIKKKEELERVNKKFGNIAKEPSGKSADLINQNMMEEAEKRINYDDEPNDDDSDLLASKTFG